MECSNQRFKQLNKHVIYQHLTGKKVVGLYPLLENNTCQLLAIDFDKCDWKEAISAVIKACYELKVPHLVEISRSGQGSYLWAFISEALPAKDVRLLGFAILDKAMELYPDLSFDSYDRLFPSQDLMPEGGFGNLIALPLQFQARKKSFTEFVDVELKPYKNQWQVLNNLDRVSSKMLYDTISNIEPDNDLEDHQYKETLLRVPKSCDHKLVVCQKT